MTVKCCGNGLEASEIEVAHSFADTLESFEWEGGDKRGVIQNVPHLVCIWCKYRVFPLSSMVALCEQTEEIAHDNGFLSVVGNLEHRLQEECIHGEELYARILGKRYLAELNTYRPKYASWFKFIDRYWDVLNEPAGQISIAIEYLFSKEDACFEDPILSFLGMVATPEAVEALQRYLKGAHSPWLKDWAQKMLEQALKHPAAS